MREQILDLPDTKQIFTVSDVVGEVSFLDFDDAIREIQESVFGLNDAAQPDEADLVDDDEDDEDAPDVCIIPAWDV